MWIGWGWDVDRPASSDGLRAEWRHDVVAVVAMVCLAPSLVSYGMDGRTDGRKGLLHERDAGLMWMEADGCSLHRGSAWASDHN
jgi:hypothetical protein